MNKAIMALVGLLTLSSLLNSMDPQKLWTASGMGTAYSEWVKKSTQHVKISAAHAKDTRITASHIPKHTGERRDK